MSDTRNATYNRRTQRTQKSQPTARHTAHARQSSGRHDRGRWQCRHHLTSDRYSVRRIRCRVRRHLRRRRRRSRDLRLRRRVHVRHRRSDLESIISTNRLAESTYYSPLPPPPPNMDISSSCGGTTALASRRMPISSRACFALSVVKYVYEVPVKPARWRDTSALARTRTHSGYSLLYDRSGGCSPRSCSGNRSSAK